MLAQKFTTAILALASLAAALPQQVPSPTEDTLPSATVNIGSYALVASGAIDIANNAPPAPTTAPNDTLAAARVAANQLTFAITNRLAIDVLTVHNWNWNAPGPISGNNGKARIRAGAVERFVVPRGWAGSVAFVEADGGRDFVGDESLLEGSFVDQGQGFMEDIDVSYVSGFSVPITCSCAGETVITGCNKPLWNLSGCPDINGRGSCRNPRRWEQWNTSPTQFFAPCRGAAYTYVQDHAANANGQCASGQFSCCIGTNCPSHPRQPW